MKKFFYGKFFTYGLFWSWNLLYVILFTALEIEMGFAYRIILDGISGAAPLDFTLIALVAYVIPLASIILAVTVFRREPLKLVKLFYGAEVPLTLICLLRLSVLKELNPGTTHLFILLLLGMGMFLFELLRNREPAGRNGARIVFAFNTVILLAGVYIGLVLIFYLPPAIAGFIYMLAEIPFGSILREGFLIILSAVFFLYSITLLLGLPVAMLYLYFRQFRKRFVWFSGKSGKKEALRITGAIVALNLILFYFLNWNQPQEGLFQRLTDSNWTKKEIAEFADDEGEIREGLLNAYLAGYRYLGEESRNEHIAEIYREAFGGERSYYAVLQGGHNILLKPFLYVGERMRSDQDSAAYWYEKLFDVSLQKEEQKEIKNALNSTWQRDQAEAGLLDIGEEKVLVLEQDVKIREKGDIAEIEIYEVYRNQTFTRQEILYYFSLPENAVLTGMWISDDPKVRKFPYRVSPRGAAQQVYKDEVSRRVDPSLLEQVGPNQYRLRAFPVEPKTWDWDMERARGRRRSQVKEGEKFYLWLQYKTLVNKDASWPMPQVLQRRNVFCNDDTRFTVNGQEAEKEDESDWLPLSVPAKQEKISGKKHLAAVAEGPALMVVPASESGDILIPENETVAIIVDGTYSMSRSREELEEDWEWLQKEGFFEKNNVDVYLTGYNAEKTAPDKFEPDEMNFFGNQDLLHILHQFDSLKSGEYDLALIFTDQGDYEGGTDSLPSLGFTFPLYLVHLDGKLPYAYQDNLLETIDRSGGRSFTETRKVFEFFRGYRLYRDDPAFISYEHGYLWKYSEEPAATEPEFAAIAARQYIRKNTPRSEEEKVASLDRIHEIAKKHGIVTPYSSMICLVNKEQLRELEEAENKADRFDRETESGKQIMPNSGFSFSEVSGTPEPEEWVLIIFSGLICLYMLYRRKFPARI